MPKKNKKTVLDWALEYYHAGINVVKAYYKGKCPPKGGEWEKYKTERVPVEKLYEWFSPDKSYSNISAVTGPISSGLTALDFDSTEAYKWWKEKYPNWAATLPTSKSARGFHVFFRSDAGKNKSFGKIEIKANSLVSLPPSMHKSGVRYEWVNPLPDSIYKLPLLNPLEWELEEFTEDTEEPEDPEDTHDTERHRSHREGGSGLDYLDGEVKKEVEKAIECTLPKNQGQRNDAVFPLCQWLRAIPELRGLPAKELKPIVREWHKQAYTVIGTKPFDDTWRDFVHAWKRVKWPKGDVMLSQAVKRVLEGKTVLPEAEEYDTEEARFLLKLCYELQQGMGDEPFFLASRKAGGIIGLSHGKAYKLLEMFVADDKLEVIEQHTTKKAPRYRYIAN